MPCGAASPLAEHGAQLLFPAWHHFTAEPLAAVGRYSEAQGDVTQTLAAAGRTGSGG
jgi:hypothetical protein